MQAYATSERLPLGEQLRTLDRTLVRTAATAGDSDGGLIDQILGRLADLVVDRLMQHTEAEHDDRANAWLDARSAAEYLGVHRDTLRKLAAERAISYEQDGPGCKLYFRRADLDAWRRSGGRPRHLASVVGRDA